MMCGCEVVIWIQADKAHLIMDHDASTNPYLVISTSKMTFHSFGLNVMVCLFNLYNTHIKMEGEGKGGRGRGGGERT